MTFTVYELPKAKIDKESIARWLFDQSPQGAMAWLDAYDDVVERLRTAADVFAEALENKDCDLEVRQALFRTRRGRFYRVVFYIEQESVYILRVRGPGQAPIEPVELI